MYIVNQEKGINDKYGLPQELRITSLQIDSKTKTVIVKWELVVVSPTGEIVSVLESGEYYRYDSDLNPKYSQLENSPIGQGIKQMLSFDIPLYPNFEQS